MITSEQSRRDIGVDLFKALAHPMRLAMIERLNLRSWCVCELAAELGLGKSVASKHLTQLYDAGLLGMEKQGTQVMYRLLSPCVVEMAACCEANARLELQRRLGDGSIAK